MPWGCLSPPVILRWASPLNLYPEYNKDSICGLNSCSSIVGSECASVVGIGACITYDLLEVTRGCQLDTASRAPGPDQLSSALISTVQNRKLRKGCLTTYIIIINNYVRLCILFCRLQIQTHKCFYDCRET